MVFTHGSHGSSDAVSFAQAIASRPSQCRGTALKETQKHGDLQTEGTSSPVHDNAKKSDRHTPEFGHLGKGSPSKRLATPNGSSIPSSRARAASLSVTEANHRQGSSSLSRTSALRRSSASSAALRSCKDPDLDPDRLDKACGLGPWAAVWGSSHTAHNSATKDWVSSLLPEKGAGHVDVNGVREEATSDSVVERKKASKYPPYKYPDIRDVLKSLSLILRSQGLKMRDYIEVEDMVEARELERKADAKRLERAKNEVPQDDTQEYSVFGGPIKDTVRVTPKTVVLGKHGHEVPLVVYMCVEEIYRTGIFQPGLFRVIPNKDRHKYLLKAFDVLLDLPEPPAFPSLRKERFADIAALFSSFISEMAEPLLSRSLFSAFWAWCVRPTMAREQERTKEVLSDNEDSSILPVPPLLAPKRLWRKRAKATEKSSLTASASQDVQAEKTKEDLDKEEERLENIRIEIAQHVLRLLPPTHLSLLGYLCAFFSQLPLCPENGLTHEDVGRLFGPKLLGGSKICSKAMMVWLLNRWDRIANGIFGEEGGESQIAVAEDRLGSYSWGDDAALRRGSAPTPASKPEVMHDERGRSQSLDANNVRARGLQRFPDMKEPASQSHPSSVHKSGVRFPPHTDSRHQGSTQSVQRGFYQPTEGRRRPHASSTSSSEASSSTDVSSVSTPADATRLFENEYVLPKCSDQLSAVCETDDDAEQYGLSVTAQILDTFDRDTPPVPESGSRRPNQFRSYTTDSESGYFAEHNSLDTSSHSSSSPEEHPELLSRPPNPSPRIPSDRESSEVSSARKGISRLQTSGPGTVGGPADNSCLDSSPRSSVPRQSRSARDQDIRRPGPTRAAR